MKRGAAVLVVLSTVTSGCSGCGRDRTEAVASSSMPPLVAAAGVHALAVPGFGEAVVGVPVGTSRPAPVLVAVLGIGDTPEGQCATWRELLDGRAFVLCPRGQPRWVRDESLADASLEPEAGASARERSDDEREPSEDRDAERSERAGRVESLTDTPARGATRAPPGLKQMGFFPPDGVQLEREIDAGMTALRARYGAYVSPRGAIYAGFSRGAFLGAALVAEQPSRFRRAVLIEGGQSPWTDEAAAAFAAGGGERVLFACGQPSCVEEASAAAAILGRRRVAARVVHGQGEGHGYKRYVKHEIRRSLGWLVEGDAEWRALSAPGASLE